MNDDRVFKVSRETLTLLRHYAQAEAVTIPRAFRKLAGLFVQVSVRQERPDVFDPLRERLELALNEKVMSRLEVAARDLGLHTDMLAEMVIQSAYRAGRIRVAA